MKEHRSMEAGIHPTTEISRQINTVKLPNLTDKLNEAEMFRAYSTHWENDNRVYDQV